MATRESDVSPSHFQWLVESRSRNQAATVELYRLISQHEHKLNRHVRLQLAAQELAGIAFSLWRAVFLSDTTGIFTDQLADVKNFLISLISDNSVLYITDKNARNWSFRYYLDNAQLRLERLAAGDAALLDVTSLTAPADSEKAEWLNAQAALETALSNFDKAARRHHQAEGGLDFSRRPRGGGSGQPFLS